MKTWGPCSPTNEQIVCRTVLMAEALRISRLGANAKERERAWDFFREEKAPSVVFFPPLESSERGSSG